MWDLHGSTGESPTFEHFEHSSFNIFPHGCTWVVCCHLLPDGFADVSSKLSNKGRSGSIFDNDCLA